MKHLLPAFLLIAQSLASAVGTPLEARRTLELETLFRPFEMDHVTLSPDGRHLAYTVRKGEELFLVLRDLDTNKTISVSVAEAQAMALSSAKEKTPARLSFLRWATDARLVFSISNVGESIVCSICADGTQARRLADKSDFAAPVMVKLPRVENGNISLPVADMGPIATTLNSDVQPLNVVALRRGSRYVFVEAVMRSHQSVVALPMDSDFGIPVPPSFPRVVLRINAETGESEEWGETEQRGISVMADQAGYPRICTLRQTQFSLTVTFMYADQRSNRWTPLDKLLEKGPPLFFHETPGRFLEERSIPLGFDYQSDLLYFASNVGRDTVGLYALNMKTRKRTEIAIEIAAADLVNPQAGMPNAGGGPLVFDSAQEKLVGVRFLGADSATLWIDPELAEIQQILKRALPRQTVEVLEWNDARDRFLVRASSQIDPGTYYVFHREENRLDHLLQRAPWLSPGTLHPATSFGFRTPDGIDLTGYLTLPRRTRLKLPPLIVLCHDGPWSRDYPGFNPEVQALASMGFAVVQVNYRGSTGFGRKHLDALRAGFDTVAAEDVVATVDWVLKTEKVDRRLVAIMGTGYGGYLALRAMQLYPTRFRCAVALDAPVDLPTWLNPRFPPGESERRQAFLGDDTAKLEAMSPLSQPDKFAGPVMLIQRESDRAARAQDLHAALAKLGREVEFLSLDRNEGAFLPQARAALFLKIEEFFNAYIYNYAVKLGETVEIK
jgi:pimeloyl-ACP methyl ester carboxylesterase